jgi:hypothetical protein
VILTGRNTERLQHAAGEIDALSTAAFDAADPIAVDRFFRDVPAIDHVMVTAARPYYGRLADMDFAKIRDLIGEHLLLALYVARYAASKVRPGGTLIFMGGGTGVSVLERSLHFGPRTSVTTPLRSKGLGFGLSCTLKYASSRGHGNVAIPKGFPRSVGRVESRLLGFPCFPYSVISMACFGNAFHKVTITAKALFLGTGTDLALRIRIP